MLLMNAKQSKKKTQRTNQIQAEEKEEDEPKKKIEEIHWIPFERNQRFVPSSPCFLLLLFVVVVVVVAIVGTNFFYLFPNEIAVDDNVLKIRQQQSNFYRWIEAFRTHSHRIAQTNPIDLKTNKNTRYFAHYTLYTLVDPNALCNSAKRIKKIQWFWFFTGTCSLVRSPTIHFHSCSFIRFVFDLKWHISVFRFTL